MSKYMKKANPDRRKRNRFSGAPLSSAIIKTCIQGQEITCPVHEVAKDGLIVIVDTKLLPYIHVGQILDTVILEVNEQNQFSLEELCVLRISASELSADAEIFIRTSSDTSGHQLVNFIHQYCYDLGNNEQAAGKKKIVRGKFIPSRGIHTDDARKKRLSFIEKHTATKLSAISNTSHDASELAGNIEGLIGSVEVPLGVAGPLLIHGRHAKGHYYAPMATTEGALTSSVTRGAIALSRSGGVTARVIWQRMIRVPAFCFTNLDDTLFFSTWIGEHFEEIKAIAGKRSNYAKLIEIYPQIIGHQIHCHFIYETADAAGQNMSTFCTWEACQWILSVFEKSYPNAIAHFIIEGNLSSDKKVSYQSFINGRGTRVVAEARIPESVLKSVLKVSVRELMNSYHMSVNASIQAGMVGMNINVANIIGAMFTALGQDIACVHESGLGQLTLQEREGGVHCTMTLPTLLVGTVGGGTNLPHQREALDIIGCAGQGKSRKLAEIIASFCLALDLSTLSAVAGGQFVSAHENLGRKQPSPPPSETPFPVAFFQTHCTLLTEANSRDIITATPSTSEGIESSIITTIAAQASSKPLGFFPYDLVVAEHSDNSSPSDTTTLAILVKNKPSDLASIQAASGIVKMAQETLEPLFIAAAQSTGFKDSHIREVRIYQQQDPRFIKYTPIVYGAIEDHLNQQYVVILEHLHNLSLLNSINDLSVWNTTHLKAAISGVAELHSIWYGREQALLASGLLGQVVDSQSMTNDQDFWFGLLSHVDDTFGDWYNNEEMLLLKRILETLPRWWATIDSMPKTLVHGDFNPRNIAFRESDEGLCLCVYDWELATLHLPQRDLVEILAFVLEPKHVTENLLRHWAEEHRHYLQTHTGKLIDADDWWNGFCLSVYDFFSNRFLLYTVGHAVQSYPFMDRLKDTLLSMIIIVQPTVDKQLMAMQPPPASDGLP